MVFTLHRYIFRQVLKVFVGATLALTTILSLGMVLQPVQEYGVGPRQVLHLIGYFLPITLTFVLPLAAIFATALVYGRFAGDNELDACRASGVSLMTLVYPGAVLAIIVAIAQLVLSFYVVPVFVQRAETALKADAKQILFRNIGRRGYYELPAGSYRIYADYASLENDTLSGVVAIETNEAKIQKIITAEKARIEFNPHQQFNEVKITAHNTYQIASEEEGGFSAEWLSLSTEFGSLLGDDIKFKKVDEMKKIRVDPLRFVPLARLARKTYAQFTTELLAQDITRKIADKSNSFYNLHSDRTLVEFTAGDCTVQSENQIKFTGRVVVMESEIAGAKPVRTLRCEKAWLHLVGDELAPTLTMELYSPAWQRADGTKGIATGRLRIGGLVLPQSVSEQFETADVLESIQPAAVAAALCNGPGKNLEQLQAALRMKIQKTLTEIEAEMHSRLVGGIGCVALIMVGIGFGIVLKGGHLLSGFGASCLPAAALIVAIMMGKNITKNPDAQAGSGIALMWVALAVLWLFTIILYRKLLKN